jgi:hypothetical protein
MSGPPAHTTNVQERVRVTNLSTPSSGATSLNVPPRFLNSSFGP